MKACLAVAGWCNTNILPFMDQPSNPNFPLTGWRWRGVSDSAGKGLAYEQYPSCDFCDHLYLRYVHALEHDLLLTR